MRLIVSATAEHGGELADVVLECAPGSLVRDVAHALAERLETTQQRVVPRGSGHLGVVEVVPAAQAAPALWWHGRELDPAEPVES